MGSQGEIRDRSSRPGPRWFREHAKKTGSQTTSFFFERYMYGYDLIKIERGKEELNPGDLCVTYLAADKYLVEEMKDELIVGAINTMDKSNVCLLFGQFLKIPFDEFVGSKRQEKVKVLNEFKKFIQAFSKDALESESFTEIEEVTLVHLLRLEFLNLSESDVLSACLRWTNAEVERQGLAVTSENKQKVFSQIKPFIRFADLDFNEIVELAELKDALLPNELASLLSKLAGWCDRVAIECETERQKGRTVYDARCEWPFWLFKNGERFSKFSINLIANRKVCITSIQTMLPSLENLELKVFRCKQGEGNPFGDLNNQFGDFKKYLVNDKWCFQPGRALEIDSDVNYRFVFSFEAKLFNNLAPNDDFTTLGEDLFKFTLSEVTARYHCIKSFTFCEISNYENAKSV